MTRVALACALIASVLIAAPAPASTAEPQLVTMSVEVEAATGIDRAQTVEVVRAILADHRGWRGDGRWRFAVVDADADVRLRIATPRTVDARCLPLNTAGRLSCRRGSSLHINSDRWQQATTFWTASLAEYRAYVVNHELGHYLGFGHVGCPASGAAAPVMQQQTKSLQGCRPNGWPFPDRTAPVRLAERTSKWAVTRGPIKLRGASGFRVRR